MPALKPIFDKVFHLSQGFSNRSELDTIPISNPAVGMHASSESFIDERGMEQKNRWIDETNTAQYDESSMSTRKDSGSGPGKDFSPA